MGTRTVYVQTTNARHVRRITYLSSLIVSGCGVTLAPEGTDGRRSTLNLSTIGLNGEATYYEANANDQFELAERVEIADEPLIIHGSVSGPTDVDVYDLGPVVRGDRVVVTMAAAESLDAAIALFDEDGTALLVNDHRNVYLGRSEPFIDYVIQHDSGACLVAVSTTPGYASSGDYALIASKQYPSSPPDPRPDVVLLVFDGGSRVRIGSRLPVEVPLFDGANIDPAYAGQTDYIIEEIVARVRGDYVALDVDILSTSEGDEFEPGMTRIYFGTYDEALLGVAEGVDEFNATRGQVAIVFTDTFEAFVRLQPTAEEIGQAIANVASHEIGHLLGMIHTGDPAGIMDVTASLSELMRDQTFTRSEIYTAVFPLGFQDALRYLLETVGGDPAAFMERAKLAHLRVRNLPLESKGPSARSELRLSSCGLP